MMDISNMIIEKFDPPSLTEYIFNNKGGSSYDVLESILEQDTKIIPTHITLVTLESLKKYGPILVSSFAVYKEFEQPDIFTYEGKIHSTKFVKIVFDGIPNLEQIKDDLSKAGELIQFSHDQNCAVAEYKTRNDAVKSIQLLDNKYHISLYNNIDEKEKEGIHSMIIIGIRYDEIKKKNFFLLQNWWKGKQFIEVDSQYLDECKSKLYYVETKQYKIPNQFKINIKNH
eukprot:TRINITY_DN4998_c0_g1_i5.p1 TRINITY_DN4998_c0_g1~~TRINITY_DN4998_c0_g1_i5.p1  ORF type:complete len:228 (-),score=40.40 TRINITY_DN4998_c0_g1_i5:47-730(-)